MAPLPAATSQRPIQRGPIEGGYDHDVPRVLRSSAGSRIRRCVVSGRRRRTDECSGSGANGPSARLEDVSGSPVSLPGCWLDRVRERGKPSPIPIVPGQSRPFPPNSHAMRSLQPGPRGDEARNQTTASSKARRVDFGECGSRYRTSERASQVGRVKSCALKIARGYARCYARGGPNGAAWPLSLTSQPRRRRPGGSTDP